MSTEIVDPRYVDVDQWPTVAAVDAMLEGQLAAVAAIKSQVPAISRAAEAAAARLGRDGRLIYVGAGTSGRIAVQDGVELFPTYNWPQERLLFLMAGGLHALTESAEGAEDDEAAARREVADATVGPTDVLIGVAASGRTPYTLAAVDAARAAGALTIGLANNPDTPLLIAAEHGLVADTGAEIIAGSTRMKAGTAQKAVLNMFSTAVMLRRGLVHRGLMVNMRVSNEKLLNRGREMVRDIAGVDAVAAAHALDAAHLEIKPAILVALGAKPQEAEALLAQTSDNLSDALVPGAPLMREALVARSDDATPLYLQLARNLRQHIAGGHIDPGNALPSERDLSEMTGLSRVTIRKGIDQLIEEGVLFRKQGSGTFVARRIETPGSVLSSFSDDAKSRGEDPAVIWMIKTYAQPTEEEAAMLKVSPASRVARLGRVRLASGEPLAIEHAVVPAEFLPDLAAIGDSLYSALERIGARPVSGVQRIQASLASPTEAGMLSTEQNAAVLRIERLTSTADGRPVEFTRSTYRGDRYVFVSELQGKSTFL